MRLQFTVCDKVWQLRIFPGGSLPPHAGFLSFYLASKAPTVTRAAYKLMILAQVLGEVDEVFVSSGVRKFEARGKQVVNYVSSNMVYNIIRIKFLLE
jgi:hypothetical protein